MSTPIEPGRDDLLEHQGPYGIAQKLEINPDLAGAQTTITWWLLTGRWHPLWTQYVISVVTLADVPGYPPAKLQHPGMTHELQVLALNPGQPPRRHLPSTLEAGGFAAVGGWLKPIDVIHQVTATDDEMRELADRAAWACVNGGLNPSTDDNRTYYREQWLQAIVKTLAHQRGEEHAP